MTDSSSTAAPPLAASSLASPDAPRRSTLVSGPLRATLFFLALPVLGEQLLNTFVGLFDTWLAGNLPPDVSVHATSAVGLAAYVSWFASLLVMLVGTGTTALVSRHEGAGDHPLANHFANQSITLAAILGAILLVAFYILAPWFALYCRMTGPAYDIAVTYLRVEACGHVFLCVTQVGCAGLRGVGNMRTPMLIFALINVVNVLASVSLVHGLGPLPAMGVNGIVGGTLTARVAGGLLTLLILSHGRTGLELHRRQLALRWTQTRRILRIGVPAAADGAIMWGGHFLFLAILSRLAEPPLGPAYFAAHIIAVRVEALTYLPAVAWAAATATMIGQALGAGDPRRAVRAGHEGVLQCGTLTVLVSLGFFLGAEFIFHHMSVDPLVRSAGTGPFRVLAWLQPALVVSIVYIGALRGAGDTRYPLGITIVGIVLRLITGYLGGIALRGGLLGAWMGMFADCLWRAAASAVRFTRGHWTHTRV